MSSTLTRALDAASAVLNEQDQRNAPRERVDPFVGTTWAFAEIDDSIRDATNITAKLAMARAERNLVDAQRLTADLNHVAFQIHEMCKTAAGVFSAAQHAEKQNAG